MSPVGFLVPPWRTPGWLSDHTFSALRWWNLRPCGLLVPHLGLLLLWAACRTHDLFLDCHGACSFHLQEGGLSWAQCETAALTLWAGTSRQQPASCPPSSSRTGKHIIIAHFIVRVVSREAVSGVGEAAVAECTPHPHLAARDQRPDVLGELRMSLLVPHPQY